MKKIKFIALVDIETTEHFTYGYSTYMTQDKMYVTLWMPLEPKTRNKVRVIFGLPGPKGTTIKVRGIVDRCYKEVYYIIKFARTPKKLKDYIDQVALSQKKEAI